MPKATKNSSLRRIARRVASNNPIPVITDSKTKPIVTKKPTGNDHTKHDDPTISCSTPQNLSRGQRKRLAKREQYLKRERLILSTLRLKDREEQQRRIDGLDTLRDALMDIENREGEARNASEDGQLSQLTKSEQQKLATNEMQQMELVMQHPAFRQDPFAAIQEHIKNTFAGDRKVMDQRGQMSEKLKTEKAEERKEEKKERLRGVGGKAKKKKKFKAGRTRS